MCMDTLRAASILRGGEELSIYILHRTNEVKQTKRAIQHNTKGDEMRCIVASQCQEPGSTVSLDSI